MSRQRESSDSWVICGCVRTRPGTAQGCLRCDSEIQPEPISNKTRTHRLISARRKQPGAFWQLRLSSVTPRWLPESACQTRFILLYVKLLAEKEEPDSCYCPLAGGSSFIFIQSERGQHSSVITWQRTEAWSWVRCSLDVEYRMSFHSARSPRHTHTRAQRNWFIPTPILKAICVYRFTTYSIIKPKFISIPGCTDKTYGGEYLRKPLRYCMGVYCCACRLRLLWLAFLFFIEGMRKGWRH